MKKSFIICAALCVIIGIILCGCQSGQTKKDETTTTSRSTQTTGEPRSTVAVEQKELSITYKGVEISESAALDAIVKALQFDPKAEHKNGEIKASAKNADGDDCLWYTLQLPNREKPDIIVEFLYNKSKDKTMYLTSVTLFSDQAKTSRNIAVGDALEKLKAEYGSDLLHLQEAEIDAYYVGNPYFDQSVMYRIYNNKVSHIHSNYNINRATEELNLPASN